MKSSVNVKSSHKQRDGFLLTIHGGIGLVKGAKNPSSFGFLVSQERVR
jgi:hypothetical protein